MKTNELTGAALDWAVDKCKFMQHSLESDYCLEVGFAPYYSTDWSLGGPIIEAWMIEVATYRSAWRAARNVGIAPTYGYGPTPLIAAMRCFVSSKLGDDIEITKELK